MTGAPTRVDDPYPAYDVRLDGDPGSCHAAAAALRAATRDLGGPGGLDHTNDPGGPDGLGGLGETGKEVVADALRLADALDRFAIELRRAQTDHARACAADRDDDDRAADERNAALALAARARRRLRIASADISAAGRYGCPP